MKPEEQNVLIIKGMIASLPAAQAEACNELAEFIRHNVKMAGSPVGELAVALIGSEMQAATN